jgi:hypothetical protein
MKPTSALLIAIATIVGNPHAGSPALAQSPSVSSPAQGGIRSQAQDQDNVLAYHGGADRSGNFTVPGLTWERARSLHLDPAFQARFVGNVYAQPLFWRTPGSPSGRLLVATEDNNVYALEAMTGAQIWTRRSASPSLAPHGDAAISTRLESPALPTSRSTSTPPSPSDGEAVFRLAPD